MRPAARHVPAFLLLVVPLIALAWLGSGEVGRIQERAEQVLRDQAIASLDQVHATLVRHVGEGADRILTGLPELRGQRLVRVAEQLVETEPLVLGLVLLAEDASLVFPPQPPPTAQGLPFLRRSISEDVNRAEILEFLGDRAGAIEALELAIANAPRVNRENVAMRAHFMLGGLLRAAGRFDAAEEHYHLSAAEARLGGRRAAAGAAFEAHDSIALLCEVAIAELDLERGRGRSRVLAAIREIADGAHGGVPDPLLEEIVRRLFEHIPDSAPEHAAAVAALRTNEVRLAGRGFATEYASFLEQSVRRRTRGHSDTETTLFQVHATPTGSTLLALRPLTDREKRGALDYVPAARWIGVRLDLDLLLAGIATAFDTARQAGFGIRVSDADGNTTAGFGESTGRADDLAVSRSSLAGLQLDAVPVDPDRYLEARRRTLRNRAILIVALCLAAGGGALLVIRSAARESELAALELDLTSRVSHELKTPLAVIKMYSETLGLGRTTSPEQTARFLSIISREADQLTRLIDRFLDFSRRGTGTFAYHREPTELGPLLRTIVDSYRPHLAASGIDVAVDAADGVFADVDRSATESAVVNLLENAAKYTPDDSRERRIEVALTTANGSAVVDVRDRGIGIPDAERERIFSSFYRATNAGSRRGAGLGLNLVAHFAAAHGGSVTALPREGGGSILRITLPTKDDDAPPEHPDH